MTFMKNSTHSNPIPTATIHLINKNICHHSDFPAIPLHAQCNATVNSTNRSQLETETKK